VDGKYYLKEYEALDKFLDHKKVSEFLVRNFALRTSA
jgi:hypothetical protein